MHWPHLWTAEVKVAVLYVMAILRQLSSGGTRQSKSSNLKSFNHFDQFVYRNESFTDVCESFTICTDAHYTRHVGSMLSYQRACEETIEIEILNFLEKILTGQLEDDGVLVVVVYLKNKLLCRSSFTCSCRNFRHDAMSLYICYLFISPTSE